jgi:hypothetical protein
MVEVDRETADDDSGAAYRELIVDFLAVRAVKDKHRGYPAFAGELVADGAGMLAERKLLVVVNTVLCKWPEGRQAPSLWFLVRKGGRAPGEFFDSFAIETELVLEALANTDSPAGDLQIALPAVEARGPGVDGVVAGDPLSLRIAPTRIELAPGKPERRLPANGIRFDVRGFEDGLRDPPPYSFAMVGLIPFLALDAAMVQYSGPTSVDLELEELRQEIERAPEG